MRPMILLAFASLPVLSFAETPRTVTLEVRNMDCAVCPITIRKALERVPGVNDAKVDFDRKTATVTYDPDRATPDALIQATTQGRLPLHAPPLNGHGRPGFGIRHHLSRMRLRPAGDHAHGCLPVLLRMRGLPGLAKAQSGRLLRFLLLRFREVPTGTGARKGRRMLRLGADVPILLQ